jgi:queuine tRNA-ribosyltransferase
MCLDECPPYGCPAEHLENAVRRTILWAKRCREATHRPEQSLFGIVQGGMNVELRRRCAAELVALDFPGYALGGFSVGEPSQTMYDVLGDSAAALPADKPRYLMGVGQPRDLLEAVARGIDMFDCVLPTRNGRNAQAFAMSGTLRLRNACHKRDSTPLESDCPCYTCRNFSRAYLHHLFLAEEMLGPQLLSLHNIAFFMRLMDQVRQAIEEQRFESFRADSLARWEPPA